MTEVIEGGTVNSISRNNGIVTKHFETRNGIATPPAQRMMAEYFSMKHVGIAPQFKGFTQNGVSMSFIDGEKLLDEAIDSYPEAVRMQIYSQMGQTLAEIHSVIPKIVYPGFHDAHLRRIYDLVDKSRPYTRPIGISTLQLLDGLTATYDAREIEKRGLAWIHGDFWPNNYIGKRVNGRFDFKSVIDWEGAKFTTPYEDFAVVLMSIEQAHSESSAPFWKGYGRQPLQPLQAHFAALKTLEWMGVDEDGQSTNFTSSFYQPKIEILQQIV